MQFTHIIVVIVAVSVVAACANPSPPTLPPAQVKESIVLDYNYICSEHSTPYGAGETHRCFFHPIQIPPQDFSSAELRAAFVRKQFSVTCKNVVILSDAPFSGTEQQEVVLRRVGLRCEQ